jgi:hypothetical protein
MKRNYLIALTLFTILSLLILFQIHAESPLGQAEGILTNKITVLNGFNTFLNRALTVMDDEVRAWDANEEDIGENRIDYASADLWGLGGAFLKQIMDMQDRAEIAVDLGAAIGAVETAKTNADEAQQKRDTAWDTYVTLANEVSSQLSLSKGVDALPVTYSE